MALGCAFALVAAVGAARAFRPALLVDPDPAWAAPRLLLGLATIGLAAAAGVLSAAAFSLWTRTRVSVAPLPRLPFSPAALAALAFLALLLGCLARVAGLGSIPEALWIDDTSEIYPALQLSGRWSDFADSVRPVPFGEVPKGTVGVLYLEYFRLLLLAFGPSTFSLRLPAAVAGAASLVASGLLARRVLPRGGATLAILVLAGLYWALIMSRVGWNAQVVAPIATLATLLLLKARELRSSILALGAGALAGIGAHVYLSAWVPAGGLLLVAAWPSSTSIGRLRWDWKVPGGFLAGLVLAALPLFVLTSGRKTPYFLRTGDQNVFKEIEYWRSPMPAFEAAADGVSAPWITLPARGWPQNVGLGLVLRVLLGVAFLRAIRRPQDELSMIVLAQGGAALAATILGGNRGVPNGFRFGYLADFTAVAAAGGAVWTLLLVRRAARRLLAIAICGLLAAGSVLSVGGFFRDFAHPPGLDPSGEETVVGRAALRWDRYGTVEVDPALLHFRGMVSAIRRYRLDPDDRGSPPHLPGASATNREFRIVRPGTMLREGERAVELVRNRGQTLAVVVGKRRS